MQNLQTQLREMSTHLEGLEKERDFYFSKVRLCCEAQCVPHARAHCAAWLCAMLLTSRVLMQLRDIEILVQGQLEVLEAEGKDDPLLRDIQKILYSTEVCYLSSPTHFGLYSLSSRTASRCRREVPLTRRRRSDRSISKPTRNTCCRCRTA